MSRTITLCLAASALACGVDPIPSPVTPTATPSSSPSAERRAPAARPIVRARARATVESLPLTRRSEPARTEPRPFALPELGALASFSVASTGTMGGVATQGTATFTGAPVIDPELGPSGPLGTGSFELTAGGARYAIPAADALAYVVSAESPSGAVIDYLVIGAQAVELTPSGAEIASVLYAVVPAADFALATPIALDGIDRFAVFLHGDVTLEPQVAALAESGSLSFGAGGTALGDAIDLSLAASFVDIQLAPSTPPAAVGPAVNIVAGGYDLRYAPAASVYCDGALAGQEAAFAALLPADIGVSDGRVSVALAGDAVELSGAIGFGALARLESDVDAPPGVFYTVAPASGVGPLSTELIGIYLAVDDGSASAQSIGGAAGAGFVNAAQDGFCQVDFEATLTP